MKSRDWTSTNRDVLVLVEHVDDEANNQSGRRDGYEKRRRMKFSEIDTRFLTLRFPLPMICKLPWPARFITHPCEAWPSKEIHRSSTVKNRPPPRIASSYLSAPSNSLTLYYESPFQRNFCCLRNTLQPLVESGIFTRNFQYVVTERLQFIYTYICIISMNFFGKIVSLRTSFEK